VAVEGLLADLELFGHPRDVPIFGQQHVALSELGSPVRLCEMQLSDHYGILADLRY
jgi:hypothetical protein